MRAEFRGTQGAGRNQAATLDPAGFGVAATRMSDQPLVRQRADRGRSVALSRRRRSSRHQLRRLWQVRGSSLWGRAWRRRRGIEELRKGHDKGRYHHPASVGATERHQGQRNDQLPYSASPPAAHNPCYMG